MGNQLKYPNVLKNNINNTQIFDCIFAMSTMQGWSTSLNVKHIFINNEKYCIFGIFDGHTSDICSNFCVQIFSNIFSRNTEDSTSLFFDNIKQTFINIFKELDDEFKEFIKEKSIDSEEYKSGTTVMLIYVTQTNFVIINAGDSRCIIIDKLSKSITMTSILHDSQNESENKLISKTSMEFSRGIGFFKYKSGPIENHGIINIPDVTIIEKTKNTIIMIATNNIYKKISDRKLLWYIFRKKKYNFINPITFENNFTYPIDKYYEHIEENTTASEIDDSSLLKICENIIDIAFDLGSKNNFMVGMFSL